MNAALICAVVLFLLAAAALAVRAARAPAPPPLPEPPAELPDNVIPFAPRRSDPDRSAASRAE